MDKISKLPSEGELPSSYQPFQKSTYYDNPTDLLNALEREVKKTEVVLDIGCGIRPVHYFQPKVHFMVDPWKEYTDILSYQYADEKGAFVFRMGALEALQIFGDCCVDSSFLIDVIEHMDKEEGVKILKELPRVSREQVIIFTPLGFMPQHVHAEESDGWGLSGGTVQEHRSGWTPEDFSDEWHFLICEKFHTHDFRGNLLKKPYGAFFAILNAVDKKPHIPKKWPAHTALIPLQSEKEVLLKNVSELSKTLSEWEGSLFLRGAQKIKRIFNRLGVRL